MTTFRLFHIGDKLMVTIKAVILFKNCYTTGGGYVDEKGVGLCLKWCDLSDFAPFEVLG